MDDLIEIIHHLSENELVSLKKLLKADKQKIKLLEHLLQHKKLNNDSIIELLGYQKNKSAYYTFKHRLLQDIIQFKFDHGKNKVVKLKEDINNLRTLLYSNQPKLLEKKLNDLMKRANDNFLFAGCKEIYLCQFLLHFHDQAKQAGFHKAYLVAQKQESLFAEMEMMFYSIVFRSHTLYYNQTDALSKELESTLKQMKYLHGELDSPISEFLYESAYLTVKTHSHKIEKDFLNRARKLLINYLNTTLQYHYPNCRFAIQCLLGKIYDQNGASEEFSFTIQELENDIAEIKGFRTYEDVYFFFLHSKLELFLRKKQYKKAGEFIEGEIGEMDLVSASDKTTFYLLYLKGVGQYYLGNFSKAYSYLLKARNYTKHLEGGERWVLIQNSIFALLVLCRENNYQLVDSEKKYLKRQIKKAEISELPIQAFLDAINLKLRKRKIQEPDEVIHAFEKYKTHYPALRLTDLEYFFSS